jgi:hypothetical protein
MQGICCLLFTDRQGNSRRVNQFIIIQMESSLLHRVDAALICLFLFVGMLLMVVLGRISGKLWTKEEGEPKGGINTLLGTMYALFGFVLAFTFGMSGARFENVRNVIVQESNLIGTAVLRADLYPDTIRDEFRTNFRKYLEVCISFYDHATEPNLFPKINEDASKPADSLWALAMRQSKLPNMLNATNNMISALNNMFDIAATRRVLMYSRVPDSIVSILLITALAMSFIGGFTSPSIRHKDYIVVIGFALLASTVVYLILDLGRPMRGLITVKAAQQAIIELRSKF